MLECLITKKLKQNTINNNDYIKWNLCAVFYPWLKCCMLYNKTGHSSLYIAAVKS